MSEQAAVATCEGCQAPLQEGWIVCPRCGTSTSGSASSDRRSGPTVSEGCPVFSGMPDRPAADLSLGRARLLGKGETLGDKYRVIGPLGAGGFGEVYEVEDRDLNRRVALKVVKVNGNGAALAEKQLAQEFAIREKINVSRHIIKAYDPRPCKHKLTPLLLLPMELADGGSLRQWLGKSLKDDNRRAEGLGLFKQTCLGIGAIHDAGAVHLDIKPENILIADGTAKVSDFGIGRFCGPGFEVNPDRLVRQGLGTPKYMSPEQFHVNRQKDIGPTSDIYSLGLVLYEILDGRPPFDGTRAELEEKHRNHAPARLKGAAEPWWPIVKRCLAKNPADRYPSVAHLLKDLDRTRDGAVLSVDVSCAECGHINDNEARQECEECGAKISALFRQCPRCSRENRVDTEKCKGCEYEVAAHFLREKRRQMVAQLKDTDPAAAIELLETMLKQGGDEEEASLIRGLREGVRQTRPPIAEAERAVECGELERALDAWGKVLEVFPRHKVALERKADLESVLAALGSRQTEADGLMNSGWFDEAEKLLLECSEMVPARDSIREQLVSCRRRAKAFASSFKEATEAQRTGALIRAKKRATAALAQAPGSRDTRELLARVKDAVKRAGALLLQARKQLASAEFDGAEQSVGEIETLQSDLDGVGDLKDELGKKRELYEQAMNEAETARKNRDLKAAVVYADTALSLCPDSGAAESFSKSVKSDQRRARCLVKNAQQAIPTAQFEVAAARLGQASELWSDFEEMNKVSRALPEARESYGEAMDKARQSRTRGDLGGAVEAAQAALATCPDSGEAEAFLESAEQDQETALQLIQEARRHLPTAEFEDIAERLRQAAELWGQSDALKETERVVADAQERYEEQVNQAESAKARQDLAEALARINVALEACPNSPAALAFAQSVAEDQDRAKRLIRVARDALMRAEFEEVAEDLQNAECLWADFDALNDAKAAVIECRGLYEGSMKAAHGALAGGDLETAKRAAGSALEACPESQEARDFVQSVDRAGADAQACAARARNLLNAAEFDAARSAVTEAKRLWSTCQEYADLESKIDSTEVEFAEAVREARAALEQGDFTGALSACGRALATCPDSLDARGLEKQIENRRARALRDRCRAVAKRKALVKWSALTLPCVAGLALLMTTNASYGAVAAGIAVGASLLNWKLRTRVYRQIREWPFVKSGPEATAALLGSLLIAAGIAGAVFGRALGGGAGAVPLLTTGTAFLLAPVIAFGYALLGAGGTRAAVRLILGVAVLGGIVTAIVFGAMWLWGWATGSFWPWCKVHQLLLIGVFGALAVMQVTVCRIKSTGVHEDSVVWLVMLLVHLFYAGIVLGICTLVAKFIADAPWQSGAAAAHLLNVARTFVGLVITLGNEE